jgi:hypothetical protein
MVRVRKPHIYEAVAWKSPAPGASDTRKVDLRGFAKLNSPAGPLCVANEYTCSRLGDRMGLPVPPGAVLRTDTGEKAWVTLSFTASPLPPVNPRDVVALVPALAAEVVVFDILIANTDRHAGNLAFMRADKRLEVFDHSHALMGPGAGAGVTRYHGFAGDLGLAGNQCLLPHLTDARHVMAAIEKVETNLTDQVIRRICGEAKSLGVGLSSSGPLADAIIIRRDNLRDLIQRESHQFRGIPATSWSVL